jgi:hypothetical protein
MDDISEEELRTHVKNFLKEIKELILAEGLRVKDRVINKESLLKLGLTQKQREDEVLSLSISNYSSGPHKDIYKPGDYWVFGKLIDGIEVYIKLKIAGPPGHEHALCLSFHKSDNPLTYPFSEIE